MFLENAPKENKSKSHSEGAKMHDEFKQRPSGMARAATFTSSNTAGEKEGKLASGKAETENTTRGIVISFAEWIRKVMPESSNKILNSLKKISVHVFILSFIIFLRYFKQLY